MRRRALQLAQRLDRDGIKLGDRVATLAWNTWRHLESWYGILGIGAVYHTVNPRLFPDQIPWIINHAEDRVMLTDLTFVPLLEKLDVASPRLDAGKRQRWLLLMCRPATSWSREGQASGTSAPDDVIDAIESHGDDDSADRSA